MKKGILIALIFALLFSCEKPLKKPDVLIPQDEFIIILEQFYLYRSLDPADLRKGKTSSSKEFAYILQNKGYDWQIFEDNYGYYMLDEKSAIEINKKVRKRLLLLAPYFDKSKKEKKKSQKATPPKSPMSKSKISAKDSLKKAKDSSPILLKIKETRLKDSLNAKPKNNF